MLVSGLLHGDLTFIYIFKLCGKSSNCLSPYKVSYYNISVHIPYAIYYITVTYFYNLFVLLNLLHLFIPTSTSLLATTYLLSVSMSMFSFSRYYCFAFFRFQI